MKKTPEQAQATIEKIIKRYGSPNGMRSELEGILAAVEANDKVSWESICATMKNFGYSGAEAAWEEGTVFASFFEELTGRVADFVVCSLSPEGEVLLDEVMNGGGEGSIQALLNNIRSM